MKSIVAYTSKNAYVRLVTRRKKVMGDSAGITTFRKRCQEEAPSMTAASTCSIGTDCSPAR